MKDENMLHPLDSFTADTFSKGELAYYQPIAPYPGWGSWGITERATLHLDFEAWLGGVPSLGFKFSLFTQEGLRPSLTAETMFQYLPQKIDLLEDYEYLRVVRKGASSSNRINASWRIGEPLRLHLSPGVTYSNYLLLENSSRTEYRGEYFEDLLSPDLSAALDWRASGWLSAHVSASYGTTFVYLDNVPKKYQMCSGVRVAPFYKNTFSLLKNLRGEAAFVCFRFEEAEESVAGPIGYLYWQWGGDR